ncbi:MAG: glutamine synthetase [Hydrotalea sp.]|nr:glutamine synthetase [Hydrotalea sp.]
MNTNNKNTNKSSAIPIIKTIDDAKKLVTDRGLTHVKLALCDTDGILRGKWVARDKFFSALDSGFGFCDVIFGWDSNDVSYDRGVFTNWDTGYPDSNMHVAVETARNLPTEAFGDSAGAGGEGNGEMNLLFLAEGGDERVKQVDPRSILKKVIAWGETMGYHATAAVEYEFFVFRETPESVREKNYQNLTPLTPGYFGYSLLRAGKEHWFYDQLMAMSNEMRMPLEGLHTETGPGVLEAALEKAPVLEAADRAAIFKTYAKILAQKNGLMATFMAKWSNAYPGQSGHIHLSLTDNNGKGVFFDKAKDHKMSDTMRHFIGGQELLMPEFLAMIAPTVNSYTRLIPGYWAPLYAAWGVENRTTALRVIGSSEKSMRVEYRVAAADQNPYLALAASLASGFYGIKNKIEPRAIITGNAYENPAAKKYPLPRTLGDAATLFSESKIAREIFGDLFVDNYVVSRHHEQGEALKAITDWQLRRYFEII